MSSRNRGKGGGVNGYFKTKIPLLKNCIIRGTTREWVVWFLQSYHAYFIKGVGKWHRSKSSVNPVCINIFNISAYLEIMSKLYA